MQKPYKGPRTIPNQVQLPGGIMLRGMPFKIVDYNTDGSPRLFELQPPGEPFDIKEPGACILFAHEDWIRSPMPGKMKCFHCDEAHDSKEAACRSSAEPSVSLNAAQVPG